MAGRAVRLLAATLLLVLGAVSARAERVDLELVLLADATGSIDRAELMFQRQGYAEAMRSPEVLNAIASGFDGRIAVTYVEWATVDAQHVVVPWMVIDGAASAEAFAERLMSTPRQAFGRNAIGSALFRGVDMLDTNAYEGFRRVIDLSADSANSWGGPPIEAGRERAAAAGVVVNGLAVLCRAADCSGRPVRYDLERSFAERIITGPGAFVVTADDAPSFADAVRQKLVLEIADIRGAPGVRYAEGR
jgi:hypothetical protein